MRIFKRFLYTALILLSVSQLVRGATVDTVDTYSDAMHKHIKAVIVKPVGYNKNQHYPVVYLLHGFSGNYRDWVKNVPAISDYADLHHILIVCPDGNRGSWYIDSPIDPSSKYETYITAELIPYIDQHYSTMKSRNGRAITGLSMGGHGAFYLAFKHQDVFGAAGAMSGGVDLRPFPKNWEMENILGKYSEKPENWEKYSVINLTYLLTPGSLAITFDCGYSDFFFQVNKNLHEQLLERNIPHDFTIRPGGHTWEYWSNSIKYQLLFFSDYFGKEKKGN
ncbi:S-formylglutathione hydrolase FrmB [Arcticibacter tournemirensis]|uniref:Esterase family protein n=1 Tax=Arcticibacter tournemirensis TaxID=699437 RepID=A0A5M9HGB5_9SPHI|nr:alpha/beta hydrolase family protein [Arcticibacter tournemirensis]KAA8485573.1 esterase family protein [Arcticibacter tournemirensis]TQM48710.1 S-formylglutathione hydrolase FrmB [Arcticibacter tournemirensis]